MKNYDAWNAQKKQLEERTVVPQFSERDIWWCNIGLNIGHEADGKNEQFERPVFVLKKFSKDVFIGLPLTSTRKTTPYYFPFTLNDRPGAIMLSQARLMSAKRLQRRLARVGRGKYAKILDKFALLLRGVHKREAPDFSEASRTP